MTMAVSRPYTQVDCELDSRKNCKSRIFRDLLSVASKGPSHGRSSKAVA